MREFKMVIINMVDHRSGKSACALIDQSINPTK